MIVTHHLLADAAATERWGAALAASLRAGDVVALHGDLGAGKTTLARGILQGLGLAGEAPSPTFAIVQPYEPPEVRLPVGHVDLYRIDDPEEAEELGLEELLEDGALLIEWPERLAPGMFAQALRLTIEPWEGGRRLTCEVPPAWGTRWPFRP